MNRRDVCVLVPTLGRPDDALALVGDVLDQSDDVAEIVLVDQSDDAAADRLRTALVGRDARIRVVREGRIGLPAARNVALANSRAPFVIFFDDDARLLPGCVAAHRRALLNPRVGAVAGRVLERALDDNVAGPRCEVGLDGRVRTGLSATRPGPVRAVKGANMAFRRGALDAIGGFDPGYTGTSFLEDADAAARVRRLGFDVVFAPDAAVVHRSTPSGGVRDGAPDTASNGRFFGTGRYLRQHRGWLGLVPAVPVLAAVAAREGLTAADPARVWRLLAALAEGARGR